MSIEEIDNVEKVANIIADRSLPSFIVDDYPMFQAFIKAYYSWLEQSKGPLNIVQYLRDYRDIDKTIDEFLSYFEDEILINFPKDMLVDKRLLVKQINNFYYTKGTQDSFKFLFRLLYNDDIELYLPKTDILRASDGIWIQDRSIKVFLTDESQLEDLSYLYNGKIKGSTSGATASVQSLNYDIEAGTIVLELVLSNILGSFIEDEYITVTPDDSNHAPLQVKGSYTKINMTSVGTHYSVGDPIKVYVSDTNGTSVISTGQVTRVGRGPVLSISLVSGSEGTGYRGALRDIEDFMYLPINHEYLDSNTSGPTLGDATFDEIGDEIISHPIPFVTVEDVADPIIFTDTPNRIGSGASGYVEHVTQDGQILSIVFTNGGDNYLLPIAEVQSENGTGAEIDVVGGGGAIQETQLFSFPPALYAGTIDVDFSGSPTGLGAVGELSETNANVTYPGYWINTQGQLSSDKVLQDNYYYQDFSYVILSSISSDKWQSVVDRIAHVAGMKSFGELMVSTSLQSPLTPSLTDVSITLG